ncbi:MAG: hypothetical protein J0L99_06780 [Chitinophagales bacterium]|nr:hypothetical protein [Chitinophagales bacterium]
MGHVHFIFEELADLLGTMAPEQVLAFRTSSRAQARLNALLEKNKSSESLSDMEVDEMEQFMLLEHIVTLAKAKAFKSLT